MTPAASMPMDRRRRTWVATERAECSKTQWHVEGSERQDWTMEFRWDDMEVWVRREIEEERRVGLGEEWWMEEKWRGWDGSALR